MALKLGERGFGSPACVRCRRTSLGACRSWIASDRALADQQWRPVDAPAGYGPRKPLYNRWAKVGVWRRDLEKLTVVAGRRRQGPLEPRSRPQRPAPPPRRARDHAGHGSFGFGLLRPPRRDRSLFECAGAMLITRIDDEAILSTSL